MADKSDQENSISITHNGSGKTVKLPINSGTMGPDVMDVRDLYSKLGLFTFDPGYGATGSCVSSLTYIDGDEGILLHRGYPIEELAEKADFLEIAYLLLEGDLPNAVEKKKFDTAITRHTMVNEQISTFFRGFRRDAHRWQYCAELRERYLRSIMTQLIFMTQFNV